jgi:predicted O-linked N-acetylglucosamine transferase (SPINDLY family)
MPQLPVAQALPLAWQHHQAGRLDQAEALYRQILQYQPRHADALYLLGVLSLQTGKHDRAVELIKRALAVRPEWPEATSNLGNALASQGQLDAAIAAYRQAVALTPNHPEAYNTLGNALQAKGQLDEAIAAFRQAATLNPRHPQAHYNLGNALQIKGQLDEAIAAYQQAINLNARHTEAHNNLGNALQAKGQLDGAIAAYRQAIVHNPRYLVAHYNLGNALQAKGQPEEAIAAYRQAITLEAHYSDAHNNLGSSLKDLGQLDEALAAFRQAMLDPNHLEAHHNYLVTLHYHPASTAESLSQEGRRWAQQHAVPLQRFIPPYANDRRPDRRLRIGYVSADFREHASAFFLMPLLTGHDHQNFEIFCYAHVTYPDHMTTRMQALADHWRSIVGLSDEAVAEMIQRDQIDILVDLKLHTAGHRLRVFARKPAPVQVTWLGYPGSTGLSTIDYRLSDSYLDPPGMDESVYSEKTIRLPGSFWCYDPLDANPPAVGPLPAVANGYVTFGCLNNFCKVNVVVLRLWAKVLHAVPASRLLLLAPLGTARSKVLQLLEQEGIAPQRLEFVPHQPRRQYLESYQRMDLGLDTFPYNGHTTSLDSIWMGVPVITRAGQTAVGRGGVSLLSNLGLPELVAHSAEEYVRIAAALANDLPRLTDLRATLRQRMERSPLMAAPRFARNMEEAYRQMWRQWCAQVSALR